ncbi:MAG: hypothetical protein OXN88_14665 [Chloroflexota bacterium]|nr:hypothetical protein [Chloroflexota bacterium]
MDQLFISAGLEQLLQFAILLFVVVGFFRQFATQRDIKKLDDRLVKLETGQTELKAGQTALETRLGALDTRFGNQEDRLSSIEKKADASLELHNAVRTDIQVLQASVNRLDSYFETPKLKSS